MEIQPFKVQIAQAVLDDLEERLRRIRWPDEVIDAQWDYGTNETYLKELVDYWLNRFDWRTQERAINSFAHYRALVGESGIHFIYERGKGPNPLPLIIMHGWPSSFFEMLKIIPLLTDPANHGGDAADSFDVVVPSLPGYGFSDRPSKRGPRNAHERWVQLMTGLGYERFAALGGDVGAGVTSDLARRYSDRLLGIYLTSDVQWPNPRPEAADLSEEERDYLARIERWEQEEGGYSHIQGTRPQTLAYGLNDSPVGLAAWIVEKFRAWSDCGGDVERRFTKDELLTQVMIYWVTETMNSSIHGYYEGRHSSPSWRRGRIEVPTAVAATPEFPLDCVVPRTWAERTYNLKRWTPIPQGGHFLAMEEPQRLVEDVRAFFRDVRP